MEMKFQKIRNVPFQIQTCLSKIKTGQLIFIIHLAVLGHLEKVTFFFNFCSLFHG